HQQTGMTPANEVRPVALALDAFDPNPPCYDFQADACRPTSNPMDGTFTPYRINALYVGGATSRYLYKLDVAQANLATGAASLQFDACPSQPTPSTPVLLGCDPMGIMRLRVSPHHDLIHWQDAIPVVPYVYAATLDGTVRVVSVDEFRECETAVDAQMVATRFTPTSAADPYSGAPNRNCLPLDETRPPGTLPISRSTALAPGV